MASVIQRRSDRLVRVLYTIGLDPSLKFGSLEEQILILARAFKEQEGLFLPVFIRPLGPEATAEYEGMGVMAEALKLYEFNLTTSRRLLRLIDRHRIEVVHWNFYHPLINKYVWYLTIVRPRVIHYMTDHNSRFLPINHSMSRLVRILKKLLFRRYCKVLCVSDFVLGCLVAEGVWSNVGRCTHFVNTERFKPREAGQSDVRMELDAEGKFVIVVVANLIREKGVDVVLRALTLLPKDVVVWIIGDGKDAGTVKECANVLEVGNRVRFLGQQRYVERYMQAADCLVCPSVWGEAAGLVVLEALACGLPVIGSKVGGIPEFIQEGRTGFLFKAGDHQQLAERIILLQDKPAVHLEMRKAAREDAVENFSIEERIGDYFAIYTGASL